MRPTKCALFVTALAAASCDPPRPDDSGHVMTDSAGIQIVESLAPAWKGTATIEPEPVLSIGREEEGPYQLSAVFSADLLEDGRIAIAEAMASEVRIFDSEGGHVRTLGGAGEGPGEFAGLGQIFAYPGDSLAAFDGRLYRTTILSLATGGYRTVSNPVGGNYAVFGVAGDGSLLLFSPGGSYRPDLEPGAQWVRSDIVSVAREDGTGTVIANLPDRWRSVRPDGNAPMPQPLRLAIHATASDGFYWATPDRYEIGFRDGEGRLTRILRRPVQPRAVDPALIQEFIEGEVEQTRRSRGDEAVPAVRARYADEPFGEYVPLFTIAFVDNDQRFWVAGSEWPSRDRPSRWSVFSPEGRWLGDVEAPDRVYLVDADDDVVLGIWRDEFDVPHVQLHRFVSEPMGG